MRKRWRLALLFPFIIALAGCLNGDSVVNPPDDERKDGQLPDDNTSIILVDEEG